MRRIVRDPIQTFTNLSYLSSFLNSKTYVFCPAGPLERSIEKYHIVRTNIMKKRHALRFKVKLQVILHVVYP